jgi:hypothetical protein
MKMESLAQHFSQNYFCLRRTTFDKILSIKSNSLSNSRSCYKYVRISAKSYDQIKNMFAIILKLVWSYAQIVHPAELAQRL